MTIMWANVNEMPNALCWGAPGCTAPIMLEQYDRLYWLGPALLAVVLQSAP